ncbi:helix-turn-helix domain-containing protein [Paenibacillus thermotolerans]|uniref:helix-turn-helix domain-containing protein n=1 Tax=Paenibacillus thermotolerans TaxID=3027807 RepID=UPI002368AC7D|nr:MULTISPECIES: helix-turn-helix domain-containing protein [unclassified Paenibacillus]
MSLPPLDFMTVSLTIYKITEMNTILLHSNGSVFLTHERDRLPDFLAGMQREQFCLLTAEAQQSPDECCIHTNDLGLSYLCRLFRVHGKESKILVNGPFLMQVPDPNRFARIDQQNRIELEAFFRGLKLMSSSTIQAIANVLDSAAAIRHAGIRVLTSRQTNRESTELNHTEFMLQQPDESYIDLIELRYQIEKEIKRAVEQGDSDHIKQILSRSKNLFDFSERFPNQPVRAMKNSLVVLNTILRGAAENGNVQPLFLHRISEKFAKQIERSDTIDSLNRLIMVMCEEYCELVRHRAISGYSPLVQKAAEYIAIHFNKPLSLNKLSDHCHVHPAHLSRQFKKETGMTLTDYQQQRRIEEAKVLLKTDRASIGWIAGIVGFDDAGYFTRVFKKLEGVTPSDFRNSDMNRINKRNKESNSDRI